MTSHHAAGRHPSSATYFFAALAAITLPFVILYAYVSSNIEAFDGTLTRIGGFLEKDFGWNGTQYKFASSRCRYAREAADYDKYYDVVVIGDSFSQNQDNGFPAFLANNSNASVIVFDFRYTSLNKILNSEIFRKTPPKVLFFEADESVLTDGQKFSPLEQALQQVEPFNQAESDVTRELTHWDPSSSSMLPFVRETRVPLLDRLDMTSDYLFKMMVRSLLSGGDLDRVVDVKIACAHCFSNSLYGHYLDWGATFRPILNKAERLSGVKTFAETLKRKVEENKQTTVFLLFFPMKSTAYSSFIDDKFHTLLDDQALYIPETGVIDVISALRQAVRLGKTDVYMPNDHHTGYAGNQAAYSALVDRLHNSGLVEEASNLPSLASNTPPATGR